MGKVMLFMILAFGVALLGIFKPHLAKVTAPLYSLLEGLVLGSISLLFERSCPGIVLQTIALTFGVLAAMLVVYKTQLIRVDKRFVIGLFAAMIGILIVYMADILFYLFTGQGFGFLSSSSPFSIGFSLFVVAVAALKLVLSFDFIVRQSRRGAPRELEWYAAFGIMVTLVWLYVEILQLLSKLRSRR
jgi:uncharacterized YccA/Bax inhibitor family protein